MTGGKSPTSTTTSSTSLQETVTPDISGVVTGDAIQGQTVNITGLSSSGISEAISGIINLATHTLDIAGEAGKRAIDANTQATQNIQAPTQSTLEKFIPIAAIVGAVATVITIWRKK